jgi:hypothetical protein
VSSSRIVCSELQNPTQHRHIIAVGTGSDPNKADERWTVDQVRAAIRNGDRFYTVSPSTGKTANVEPYDCACGYKSIRSTDDAVRDNNLDYLRACRAPGVSVPIERRRFSIS